MPHPCLGIPHPQPLEMPRRAPRRGAEGSLPEPRGSLCWWGGGGAGRGRRWERVPVPPAASQRPHMCAGSALHKGGSEALRSRAWRRHSPNGATGCGQLEPHGDGSGWPQAARATPPGTRTPPAPLPGAGVRFAPRQGGGGPMGSRTPLQHPPNQPAAPPGLRGHVPCPLARVPRRIPVGCGARGRAVPGMGVSWRALASAPAPRSSLLSGLISRCLLAALNMSRARGGRKEPLLPGDGVEAKPHAPAPPSRSLPPPPRHPDTLSSPPCQE